MPSDNRKKIQRRTPVSLHSRSQSIAVATLMTIRYYIVSFLWLFITRYGAHYIIQKRCLYEKKRREYNEKLQQWNMETSSDFFQGRSKAATSVFFDKLQKWTQHYTGMSMKSTFNDAKNEMFMLFDFLDYITPGKKKSPEENSEQPTESQYPKPIEPTEDMLDQVINYVVTKHMDMCIVLQDLVDGTMGNMVFGLLAVGGWK